MVLGVAYFERNVVDRHPVRIVRGRGRNGGAKGRGAATIDYKKEGAEDDVVMEDAANGGSGGDVLAVSGGTNKRRRTEDGANDGSSGTTTTDGDDDENGRGNNNCSSRTTLLRGIRINPAHNPEVRRRSTSSRGGGGGGSGGSASTSNDNGTVQVDYRGIPAALATYVLSQSLRFGTTALGINCIKDERAEAFYSSLLACGDDVEKQEEVARDDDGRKYYRLSGDDRWTVLRATMERQIQLRRRKSSSSSS